VARWRTNRATTPHKATESTAAPAGRPGQSQGEDAGGEGRAADAAARQSRLRSSASRPSHGRFAVPSARFTLARGGAPSRDRAGGRRRRDPAPAASFEEPGRVARCRGSRALSASAGAPCAIGAAEGAGVDCCAAASRGRRVRLRFRPAGRGLAAPPHQPSRTP